MPCFFNKYRTDKMLLLPACFLVLIIGISGAAGELKPREIIFSHRVHLDMGIECEDCHSGVETSVKGTDNLLPGMLACGECHDVEEAEACKDCHRDKENPRPLERITDYSPKFSHEIHQTVGIDCERCHEGVSTADSSSATPPYLPPMEPCMACHDGETADKSCIICHEKPEGKYPANHVPKEWIIDHVFEYSIDLGGSCKSCHTNESCQRCHIDKVLLKP